MTPSGKQIQSHSGLFELQRTDKGSCWHWPWQDGALAAPWQDVWHQHRLGKRWRHKQSRSHIVANYVCKGGRQLNYGTYSIAVETCKQIESNCGAALTLKNKKFKDPPPTIFTTKHIAATSVSVRKDVRDLWAPSRWLIHPVHRSTPFDNSDIKIYKTTESTLYQSSL